MRGPRTGVVLLYGATIFASSFLLFVIQPIFAKLILPWFGGSAAVWTTCLVFFQAALLAGYAYAHAAARWPVLHIALLALALPLLPAIPGPFWKAGGGEDPTWRLLALLACVLGPPYVLLAATSPLLQGWFARSWPERPPYRLFAVSNAASLAALAGYPVLIEPRLPARAQDVAWSFGFAGLAGLCALTAVLSPRNSNQPGQAVRPAAAPTREERLLWTALAAGGSMLLLATTNQLTANVAAVPFLWILPLAVYLLTFILCFESRRWYRRELFLRLLAVGLCSVAYATYDIQMAAALLITGPILAFGLFAGCMFCHGELSARKPEGSLVTAFYLYIALGGAIGGVLIGLVAPRVFRGVYELPLTLLAVAALALWQTWPSGWQARMLWSVVAAAMAIAFGSQVDAYNRNSVVMLRSFYGALRVVETAAPNGVARTLYHGTIKHGSQFVAPPARRMTPTSYYGPQSGAGLAMRLCCTGPRRVGLVGLGAGSLAVYGKSGDVFRFYEINPQVIRLANTLFTYTRETPARVEIAQGDARLTLESEPSQAFDLLVLDAFSGDAIPVHLLTKEAFAVYQRHLKSNGILAIHISNQFLDLAPVVRQLGDCYGLPAVRIHTPADPDELLSAADWVLLTRDSRFIGLPEVRAAEVPIAPRPDLRIWTDDYNNLFQVMKWKY